MHLQEWCVSTQLCSAKQARPKRWREHRRNIKSRHLYHLRHVFCRQIDEETLISCTALSACWVFYPLGPSLPSHLAPPGARRLRGENANRESPCLMKRETVNISVGSHVAPQPQVPRQGGARSASSLVCRQLPLCVNNAQSCSALSGREELAHRHTGYSNVQIKSFYSLH